MKRTSKQDFRSLYPSTNMIRKHLPVNEPLTKQEIEIALTFLLSSGAITTKQFTEYRNKALPFTRG